MKTLPKAQRTRGLSSYHKFKHKSWPNFIFRISTKHQLQNHNETSASPQNLSFKILAKLSFRISIKIQLHNLYKTSAEKTDQAKPGGRTGLGLASWTSWLNKNMQSISRMYTLVSQCFSAIFFCIHVSNLLNNNKCVKCVKNQQLPLKNNASKGEK